MSAEIIQFIPRPNPNRDDPMADHYADCALHGMPASPNKARLGMPGIVLTAHGDLIHLGSAQEDTSPCEMIPYHAPEEDPA